MISGTCGDNLTWNLDNSILTIEGIGNMDDYFVQNNTLPPWYNYKNIIKSVIIKKDVTNIGQDAFHSCENIVDVVIYSDSSSNTEKSIGNRAFWQCKSLKNIVLPDNITSIGQRAFGFCSFTSFKIPLNISTLSHHIFYRCNNLYCITIPDSVTTIGDSAFSGCYNLTSITIPDSVTTIGDSAFSGCDGLTLVIFMGNREQWDNQVQKGYENDIIINNILCQNDERNLNLKFINNSSLSLQEGVFSNNKRLKSFNYDDEHSIKKIDKKVFQNCSNLSNLTLQNGIEYIGENCFDGCAGLQEITIPNSVNYIGEGCIRNCTNLLNLSIPFIGTDKIYNNTGTFKTTVVPVINTKLSVHITLGNVLQDGSYFLPAYSFGKNLGNDEYEGIPELVTLTLADTISFIGQQAISGCGGLKTCKLPTNNNLEFGIDVFAKSFSASADATNTIICLTIGNITSSQDNPNNYNIILNENNYVTGLEDKKIIWQIIKCVNEDGITIDVADVDNQDKFIGNPTEPADYYISGNWTDSNNNPKGLATYACLNWKKRVEIDKKKDEAPQDIGICGEDLNYQIFTVDLSTDDNINKKKCVQITGEGTEMFNYSSGTQTPWNNEEIYAVILPSNIKTIGDYSFAGASNLQYVCRANNNQGIGSEEILTEFIKSLSNNSSIVQLGDYRYSYVNNNLVVSNNTIDKSNCINIGQHAFEGCVSIKKIQFRNDEETASQGQRVKIGDYAFKGCTGISGKGVTQEDKQNNTTLILGTGPKDIGQYAFQGIKLYNIVLPTGSLGNKAFVDCDTLQNVMMVAHQNQTIYDIFGENTRIRNLRVNSGDIAPNFFEESETLNNLILGEGITSIGDYAFRNCKQIKQITWNVINRITTVNRLFDSAGIENNGITIIFGENVNYIPDCLFYSPNYYTSDDKYPKINKIIIGQNITEIGRYALYCKDGNQTILEWNTDNDILYDDSTSPLLQGIYKIVFGDNVTHIIGDNFFRCNTLQEVVIGKNVERIEKHAFSYYSHYKKYSTQIIFSTEVSNLKIIGQGAFQYCTFANDILIIPKSVSSIEQYAFRYGKFTKVKFDNAASLQTMGTGVFEECRQLKKVELPKTIKNIPHYTFYWCDELEEINLPFGLESISVCAFEKCKNLVSIDIPSTVTTIGRSAFEKSGLQKVVIYASKNITNYNLTIEDSAFQECDQLRKFYMPIQVKKIKYDAFRNIEDTFSSDLFMIYYQGSENDWSKVEVATNAFRDTKWDIQYETVNFPEDSSTLQTQSIVYDENNNISLYNIIPQSSQIVLMSSNAINIDTKNYQENTNNSQVLYLLNGKEYAWKLYLYDNKYDVYITDNNTYSENFSYLPIIYAPTNSRVQVGQQITLQGENSYSISNIDSFKLNSKIFYRQSKGITEGQISFYGVLSDELTYNSSTNTYTTEKLREFLSEVPVSFSLGTKFDRTLVKGEISISNNQIKVTLNEGINPEEFLYGAPIALEKITINNASVSTKLLNIIQEGSSFTVSGDNGLHTIHKIENYYDITFTPGIEVNSSGYSSMGITMYDSNIILPQDILPTQVLIVVNTKGQITIVGDLGEEIKRGIVDKDLIQLIQKGTYFMIKDEFYYVYKIDKNTNTIYFSSTGNSNGRGYIIERTDIYTHDIALRNYIDMASNFDLTDLHLTLNYINIFDVTNIIKYEEDINLQEGEIAYLITADGIIEPTSYEVSERELEKEAVVERYSSILTVTTLSGLEPNHTLVDKNTVYYIHSNNVEVPAYYFNSVNKGKVSLFIETNDMNKDILFESFNNQEEDNPYEINCTHIKLKGQYDGSISYYVWDLQEWDEEDERYYSIYTEENQYTSNLTFVYHYLKNYTKYRLILSIVTPEGLVVSTNYYFVVNYAFNKVNTDGAVIFKDCNKKAIAIDFTNLAIHISSTQVNITDNNKNETETNLVLYENIIKTFQPFSALEYNTDRSDNIFDDLRLYIVRQIENNPDSACIIGIVTESDFKSKYVLNSIDIEHQCCFYDYSFNREEKYIYTIIPELIKKQKIEYTDEQFNSIYYSYYGIPYIINNMNPIQYNLKLIQLIETENNIDDIINTQRFDNIYKYSNEPYSHWTFKYNTDANNITINTDKTIFDSTSMYATIGKTNRNYKNGVISALLGSFVGVNNQDVSSLTYRDSIKLQNKFQEFANSGKVKLLRDEIGNVIPVDITFKGCTYNAQAIPTSISINFEWTQIAPDDNFSVYDVTQNIEKIRNNYQSSYPFVIFKEATTQTYQDLQVMNCDVLELQVDADDTTNFVIEVVAVIENSQYFNTAILSEKNCKLLNTITTSGLYRIEVSNYNKILIGLNKITLNGIVDCYGKQIKYINK